MKIWACAGAAILGGAAYYGYVRMEAMPAKTTDPADVGAPCCCLTPEMEKAYLDPASPAPVVEVADLDALLDPPPIPLVEGGAPRAALIAVGYEEPARAAAASTAAVVPIPPAVE